MACAWQESINPNLLCQDTQKISFSFAAFQLIITEVFHCKEITANTRLQPQGEINPSEVKWEKSHKKSGLKSVLKNMAQGPMPDAALVLAPCAVLTPIIITAIVAVGAVPVKGHFVAILLWAFD